MPAYFNISLLFSRNDIASGFVGELYSALEAAGMEFTSVYPDCPEKSLDEIACFNQAKLESNFRLGLTEHYMNDYRQACFSYGGFSELRCFFLNNYPAQNEFVLEIIMPESEVVCDGYPLRFNKKSLGAIFTLAQRLWYGIPCLKSVQTGTECCDDTVGLEKISQGACPNVNPFAFISGNEKTDYSGYGVKKLNGAKGGLLVYDESAGLAFAQQEM